MSPSLSDLFFHTMFCCYWILALAFCGVTWRKRFVSWVSPAWDFYFIFLYICHWRRRWGSELRCDRDIERRFGFSFLKSKGGFLKWVFLFSWNFIWIGDLGCDFLWVLLWIDGLSGNLGSFWSWKWDFVSILFFNEFSFELVVLRVAFVDSNLGSFWSWKGDFGSIYFFLMKFHLNWWFCVWLWWVFFLIDGFVWTVFIFERLSGNSDFF